MKTAKHFMKLETDQHGIVTRSSPLPTFVPGVSNAMKIKAVALRLGNITLPTLKRHSIDALQPNENTRKLLLSL